MAAIRGKNGNFVKKTPINVARHHVRSKKLLLPIVALTAVVGAVVVFVSNASTAPLRIYIGWQTDGVHDQNVSYVRTDGTGRGAYAIPMSVIGYNKPDLAQLSRDRKTLAIYNYRMEENKDVALINAQTGALKSKIYTTSNTETISWLPQDKALVSAFNGDASSSKVYISSTPVDGSQRVALAQNNRSDANYERLLSSPTVQPQQGANKILYLSEKGINTMNLDGSGKRLIVPGVVPSGISRAYWSSDGKQIAYQASSYISNRWSTHLWVADSDGGNRREIATISTAPQTTYDDNSSRITERPWSPGNSEILFKRSENRVENLYTANLKSGKVTKLTSIKSAGNGIKFWAWSRYGKIIYAYGPKDANGTISARTVKSINASGSGEKILFNTTDTKKSINFIAL